MLLLISIVYEQQEKNHIFCFNQIGPERDDGFSKFFGKICQTFSFSTSFLQSWFSELKNDQKFRFLFARVPSHSYKN